jgi:hypothetical protein
MSMAITNEVLHDDLAVLLACAVAAANTQAREFGVDVSQSLITISQVFEIGPRWRVNYGSKDFVGRRGGDIIVDVDAIDATVRQVLRCQ